MVLLLLGEFTDAVREFECLSAVLERGRSFEQRGNGDSV